MNFEFTAHGWEDFEFWMDNNEDIINRIRELLKDISREPFKGIGKPEPLKGDIKGFWSRRINEEHRLVYEVTGKPPNQKCTVYQCRFHYTKR